MNPDHTGTKAGLHYRLAIPAQSEVAVRLRLRSASPDSRPANSFGPSCDALFDARIREADAFYNAISPQSLDDESRLITRQAFAGLLWSKQFYHFVVKDWLAGDSAYPPPVDEIAVERILHVWR